MRTERLVTMHGGLAVTIWCTAAVCAFVSHLHLRRLEFHAQA